MNYSNIFYSQDYYYYRIILTYQRSVAVSRTIIFYFIVLLAVFQGYFALL